MGALDGETAAALDPGEAEALVLEKRLLDSVGE
jgi:hypothetical protein